MIKLVPMSEAEFETFLGISMQDQAQGQVLAGSWKAEDAEDTILKLREQLLPEGLNTPDHYFFNLETEENAEQVGALWFALDEHEGEKIIFVMDIQIDPQYRRRGYATQAFLLMEEKALEMGIATIILHVFMHNKSARAMYEKLGYAGSDETMVKKL